MPMDVCRRLRAVNLPADKGGGVDTDPTSDTRDVGGPSGLAERGTLAS